MTEYDAGGNVTAVTVHFFAHDGHGSVRVLVNEDGTTAQVYLYDAYGNLLNIEANVALTASSTAVKRSMPASTSST